MGSTTRSMSLFVVARGPVILDVMDTTRWYSVVESMFSLSFPLPPFLSSVSSLFTLILEFLVAHPSPVFGRPLGYFHLLFLPPWH